VKPLVRRLLFASLGALAASLALPEPGIWPLVFVGIPAIVWSFRGATVRQGVLLGFVAGFVYYGSVARWLTVYLGIVPWLGLVGAQAVLFALGGNVFVATWRGVDRLNLHSFTGRLGASVLLGATWIAREAIAAQWPWGGFAWGRAIHALADTPFRYLATLWGMTGASAVVVIASLFATFVWQNVTVLKGRALHIGGVVATVGLMLPVPYLMLVSAGNGSIRVAAVQGNSDSALFSTAAPGDSIRQHFAALNLAPVGSVDAVIWPENAMDIDPLRNASTAAIADLVSSQHHADFIFGTLTQDGDKTFNSVLQWRAGQGAVDQYDKIHPVPFAEYLPARDFFYPLAPSFFDMVPRDYTIGTRDTVMTVGNAVAGIAICYDVVDDSIFREMLAQGANVIFAPTNNSDFGHSDESIQQLQLARLRAVETGRSVVNISTVGVSAIIAPDGRDIDTLPPFTAGTMVKDVPLSTIVTPGSVIGYPLEIALIVIGIAPIVTLFRRRTS
jgi:apolipoprotein N-acyltransferase